MRVMDALFPLPNLTPNPRQLLLARRVRPQGVELLAEGGRRGHLGVRDPVWPRGRVLVGGRQLSDDQKRVLRETT